VSWRAVEAGVEAGAGVRLSQDLEFPTGDAVHDCRHHAKDQALRAGPNWIGTQFSAWTNPGMGGHHLNYFHGLERGVARSQRPARADC
jgi:hypothetical protein